MHICLISCLSQEARDPDLDLFVDLVDECLVKVERVLLFADVDAVAPESEHLPEVFGNVVLQLAIQQMSKHVLNLVKHTVQREKTNSCFFAEVVVRGWTMRVPTQKQPHVLTTK